MRGNLTQVSKRGEEQSLETCVRIDGHRRVTSDCAWGLLLIETQLDRNSSQHPWARMINNPLRFDLDRQETHNALAKQRAKTFKHWRVRYLGVQEELGDGAIDHILA